MKTFARIASALVLITAAAGTTFAAGTRDSSVYALSVSTVADQTTVGFTTVPVTQDVRNWFQAHGVDGSKLDQPLASMSMEFKNDVADLVADSDRRDELTALINPALKAALVRGQIEVATMHIGRSDWTLSLHGSEDVDNR